MDKLLLIVEPLYHNPEFDTYWIKFNNKLYGSFTTRIGAEAWLEHMQNELDLDI